MSRTFSVKNKKPLFRKMKIMTVEEILNLDPTSELLVYNLSDDMDEFHHQISLPLTEFECILLGVEGKSGRGFEVSYSEEKQTYDIRMFTPSTTTDWQFGFAFIKQLAIYLKSDVIDEEDIVYTSDNINYNFKGDIEFGIKLITESDSTDHQIFGLHRVVCFNEKMINDLKQSEDTIAHFDKIVTELQYLDAYSANQQFFQKDDETLGVYTLSQELATILPYQPYVEFHNLATIKDEDITKWIIDFVTFEDENDYDTYSILGRLDYSEFIKKLPKNKYHFIDGKYILIEGLDKATLTSLL